MNQVLITLVAVNLTWLGLVSLAIKMCFHQRLSTVNALLRSPRLSLRLRRLRVFRFGHQNPNTRTS
jgi:hypothetical protein